ncbi:hypothetical protein BC833DRAFT_623828 [Globomyces pollinis-pini]|nr:hypothetical protein BC833DRAFT_623828 [Globomyces pollinis-pini]
MENSGVLYCPFLLSPYSPFELHTILQDSVVSSIFFPTVSSTGLRSSFIKRCRYSTDVDPKPTLEAKLSPKNMLGLTEFDKITGKIQADGLSRYELDFFETAEWSKKLLQLMCSNGSKLQAIAKQNQYSPPDSKTPVCIQFVDHYTYDFTRPKPLNNKATVSIHLPKLNTPNLNTHTLKLLAGDRYDPYNQTISITADVKPQHSVDETVDRPKAVNEIMNQLNLLLKTSTEEKFDEIPLDLKYVRVKKSKFPFPKQWLQQPTKGTSETVQGN